MRQPPRPAPSSGSIGVDAAVAFLAALLVLGLGTWQILRARDAILRDAESNIQIMTRSLAQHAGRTIDSVDLALLGAVEQLEAGADPRALVDHLRRREAILAQVYTIVVVGPDGAWVADTAPAHGPLNSTDRAYFQWHRAHADRVLHIDLPTVGRTTGRVNIPLSRRITRPDGSFGGLVVASLAPDYFERFYRTVKTGTQGAIGLWTDQGRLLLRYPTVPDQAQSKQAVPQTGTADAFRQYSGVERSRSPWDGVERLFAFEHIDQFPLVISAAVSVDDVLAEWRRGALVEGAVIGGGAIALVLLSLGFEVYRRRLDMVQAASRESDRQYRLLADNSHDLIALKPSFAGARAYVSPSSRQVVGWEPEELAALPTDGFVHPDDCGRVLAEFSSLTAEQPTITSQHRVKHKSGHYIWLEVVFRRTGDGSVLVSARDVTARRQAEQALAESESRFRTLADASSDMIQRLDLSGHRTYASPAAAEIFGRPVDAMIGTHPVDFIHPDDAIRVGTFIQDLTAGRSDRARSIHRIHHQAGSWVWVEVQFRLVRDGTTGLPLEVVSSVRDISERQLLQQQHEEANRRLRLAEDIAHVGHWRLELPSQALSWSDQVYRMHGLDPATYGPTVATAIGLYHPDDRGAVEGCVAQALAEGKSYEFGARILRPDGDIRHVLSRGLCETAGTGEMTAVFGTILDVTDLRQAERAAVESEARYRLLADHTTDMITHMDLDGRRLFVSPGSRELLGYDPEELVGTTPQAMIHPDDAPGLRTIFADLAAGRRDRAVNTNRLRHRDGRWIWVEASLKRLTDGEGRPVGFVGAIRNIMDRKLADEALRASEARYRVLAETTTDVITQLDLSMHRQYVSPACMRLLGFRPEEMLGRRPSNAIHPEEADAVRALAQRLALGEIPGDRAVVTYRTKHKEGHWLWVEAGLNLLRDQATGEPQSMICSLRDVTERQRAARHLERTKAAAEQAARLKAEFLATMSHELRTPLTGILGVHDLLRQDRTLDQSQRRLVGLASDAGLSLLAIVNDVLDFSKIEAGQMTIETVPFDLDDLVASCCDLAAESLKGKPIVIVKNLHPAAPRRLIGDPTRLRQILLNLLTNAVKFTDEGQVVVDVGYTHDAGVLRIDVSDTGVGIPPDRAARLFERFTQADSSMSRRYGGTGLGLAICKRLTDLMNGRIGAEARVDGGSRFWFDLPLHPFHDRSPETGHRDENAPAAQRRLLLAEDNVVNAEIISAMLTAQGHSVTVVGDGGEAMATVCSQARFDLILMDLQMPVMDGLAATAAIREHEASTRVGRVPIVGLTANALAEDAAICLAAGMDAHVAKPIAWTQLFAVIDRFATAADAVQKPWSADGGDRSAFDPAWLNELVAVIDPETSARLLTQFAMEMATRVEELEQASDHDRVRLAHKLGGVAGQLGFTRLSNLCMSIEQDLNSMGPNWLLEFRRAAEHAVDLARAVHHDEKFGDNLERPCVRGMTPSPQAAEQDDTHV